MKLESNMTPDELRAQLEADAQRPAYQGPKKFTQEEIEDGERGIRWVTNSSVGGRPTEHDVIGYLKQRGNDAKCGCAECAKFYAQIEAGGRVNTAEAYDMIDRYLRNNLGDDDYAEYSNALEASERKPLNQLEREGAVELWFKHHAESCGGFSPREKTLIRSAMLSSFAVHGIKEQS